VRSNRTPLQADVDKILQQTTIISEGIQSLKPPVDTVPDIWLDTMITNARQLLLSLNELQHHYFPQKEVDLNVMRILFVWLEILPNH
jgi:hypothetical protein